MLGLGVEQEDSRALAAVGTHVWRTTETLQCWCWNGLWLLSAIKKGSDRVQQPGLSV